MSQPEITTLCRVVDEATGQPTLARRLDDRWFGLSQSIDALHRLIADGDPLPAGTPLESAGGQPPRRLSPCSPSKIVCVGLNYQHHADEMNKSVPEEPLLFMKPPTSVIGPGESIQLPDASGEVHHEGELAIIIGATLEASEPQQAEQAIFGYTCACDVTARDIQRREKRYTRAKGYRTFAPLGPAIALARDFHPADHHLTCRVDGQLRQNSSLDDFIFSIPTVLAFISQIMPLWPGDVGLTGTPAGVGPIIDGQTVTVTIDGIGTLENPVIG